ncbi:MAG: NAD(P)/FAD-dependent oxidoreductase [Pseudomonadota bacterium]
MEKVNTVVVGAGQAGIAMSEHLGKNGLSHVVFEREQIADRWRNGRWDSLVANGPAWHDRFPGMAFEGFDSNSFVPKDAVADYLVSYAENINAPVRGGVAVTKVQRNNEKRGFLVTTSEGKLEADNVVAATGAFQNPFIPPLVPENSGITQVHSINYRNPQQLPEGAVMVIGAGSSGVQIADELHRSGREVYLSVGPHDRPPRTYRGRDNVWWLGVLGLWDAATMAPGKERFTICVSGAHGGHTVDFRKLGNQGITLVGMTQAYDNDILTFAQDLKENIAIGDRGYLAMLDQADVYVKRNGLDLPEEPEARVFDPDPQCLSDPLGDLNLAEANVTSIIWATGFTQDFSWLNVDAFDEDGRPRHQRGISTEPGIFFLGLPWQTRRASSFIWGVWHDAREIAGHISNKLNYLDYYEHSK